MLLYSKLMKRCPCNAGLRWISGRRPYLLPKFNKKTNPVSAKVSNNVLRPSVPMEKYFRNEFNSFRYYFVPTPIKYELLENYKPHLFDLSKRLFTEEYIRVRAVRPSVVFENIHEVNKFRSRKETPIFCEAVEEEYPRQGENSTSLSEDLPLKDKMMLKPTDFDFDSRDDEDNYYYEEEPDDDTYSSSKYGFAPNKYGKPDMTYHLTSEGYDYYYNLQSRKGHGYSKYPDEYDM